MPENGQQVPSAPLERVPPHSIDAEEGLLASCILGGQDILGSCEEAKLTYEAFYKPAHQIIYQVLRDFVKKGQPIDEILLIDELNSRKLSSLGWKRVDPAHDRSLMEEIGGFENIQRITERIETTVHAPYWLELVREKWLLRKLIQTTSGIVRKCYEQQDSLDEFIDAVEKQVFELSQDRVSDSAVPISKAVDVATMQIQKLMSGEVEQGVMTGYTDLDKMTYGLHGTEMIVLAARPSMGKTSFAMNLAEHAALPKKGPGTGVLVFSLEMGADQLAMRLLCRRARVNMKKVRDRMLNKEELRALSQAGSELKQAELWIDDSSQINILELRAKARRIQAKNNSLGLIVIDYLQLIAGTDSRVPREQQIAEISRGIKGLAKELNVPVIVLSQLNRASEKEQRQPRLSDLRESGSIEQDADVVFLLAKDRESSDNASVPSGIRKIELIIAKQRNGPVGSVPLTFVPDYTSFENYTEAPNEL
ncbi:MAG: replicative DNA helicase [Opitutales bacterium]|nr:replicative DNA helicase [Opitutales bacterium]